MRDRFNTNRWRSRLVVGIMVLTLLLLASITAFTFLAYQRAAADLVIESDRQLAYVAATRLRDELFQFAEELTALARNDDIRSRDPEKQRAALQAARNRLTIFDGGVVLLDNFGRVRAAMPERPQDLGEDWTDRNFFRQLLVESRVIYSDITNDGPDGTPVAVVSVPILGNNDEILGALAGMFRLGTPRVSSFYASIVRLRIGQSGNTYILDSNSRILYDSDYSRVGETLLLPENMGADPRNTASRTLDIDGNDIILAYAPVPGTHWTLVLEDDWQAAIKSTQGYGRMLLVLLGMGMILPALGVGLLIRTQNAEILERERIEQEQRVAGLIQQRLLPQVAPMLPGWDLAVHHESIDTPGQDFYDFLLLPDGQLMLAVGHIADEGLVAAHLLSSTRSALRGAARLSLSPGAALAYCNNLLCPEIEREHGVLAVYASLDPRSGRLRIANGGFNQPWICKQDDVETLSIGSPLGITPDERYGEDVVEFQPGDFIIFYSGGLVEARTGAGECFGLAQLQSIVADNQEDAEAMVAAVALDLHRFVGKDGRLADDLTIVILRRLPQDLAVAGDWRAE